MARKKGVAASSFLHGVANLPSRPMNLKEERKLGEYLTHKYNIKCTYDKLGNKYCWDWYPYDQSDVYERERRRKIERGRSNNCGCPSQDFVFN